MMFEPWISQCQGLHTDGNEFMRGFTIIRYIRGSSRVKHFIPYDNIRGTSREERLMS